MRLQLPDSPSRETAATGSTGGAPGRPHLHGDHQDLHHLQHQLKGLATLGPKFVTGTHEEVLETAAEVFLFQRGWGRWRSPRLGPIPKAGGQEVLSLCGNGGGSTVAIGPRKAHCPTGEADPTTQPRILGDLRKCESLRQLTGACGSADSGSGLDRA